MVEATYRVKEARKQLYSENGRHPNNEEVAEATGLSMKRLNAVLLTPKAPRSLDQKIGINQNLKPSVYPVFPSKSTSSGGNSLTYLSREYFSHLYHTSDLPSSFYSWVLLYSFSRK